MLNNAPIMKAKNKTIKISGQPKIKPRAPTSLKSPKPIALPLLKRIIVPKIIIPNTAAKK